MNSTATLLRKSPHDVAIIAQSPSLDRFQAQPVQARSAVGLSAWLVELLLRTDGVVGHRREHF
jgi:hypothetical protein